MNTLKEVSLFLHSPNSTTELNKTYKTAFAEAVELYVLSAYLTHWDSSLPKLPKCENVKIIVGKDFGLTRIQACKNVTKWLPPQFKFSFLVADGIQGFHPKAIFWKNTSGHCYALIGSSNLSHAAFNKNVEANIVSNITLAQFNDAKQWVNEIAKLCVPVTPNWLNCYKEASISTSRVESNQVTQRVSSVELPNPLNAAALVKKRRAQLAKHNKVKPEFHSLFEQCASAEVTSLAFYERLPKYWYLEDFQGSRLQGKGWERKGKTANFRELSKSFVSIVNASDENRDSVVVNELDKLEASNNSARKAFFSEMLCLAFPEQYLVLNSPLKSFLKAIGFAYPKGASQGAKYLLVTQTLRASLQQNPKSQAKNLAELDILLWQAYGNK
ncbi:phospholipase D family protein [Alteromonas sp. a30]|uniref:phospholipase D family protein n=1 Tax=Alteromonas sp. a30 TaxID=2730917 RepID=UPI002282093A|nr:phospholipase D family protein [Alteromonas sp. a30]MCY7294607.1 hypothetical protein [Alteromonas sp. a30]